MIEYLDLLIWPLIAAFVLTGIHVYLGLHVVTRGVIFVDLALAQVAALGMACGVFIGLEHESALIYLVALLFTVVGAALLAMTRSIEKRFNQEAIIGIVYVVSAAIMILVLSRLAEGSEHLNHLLVGSILFVSPSSILKTAVLYSFIGLFHYRFRQNFFTLSKFPDSGEKEIKNSRFWDFLFFLTFGIVVTSSVQIAGIFLVFSYLIIPAVAAMLIAKTIIGRLIVGWVFGLVGSILGILLSVLLDLPTGASIVVTFGLLLVLVFLIAPSIKKQ